MYCSFVQHRALDMVKRNFASTPSGMLFPNSHCVPFRMDTICSFEVIFIQTLVPLHKASTFVYWSRYIVMNNDKKKPCLKHHYIVHLAKMLLTKLRKTLAAALSDSTAPVFMVILMRRAIFSIATWIAPQ